MILYDPKASVIGWLVLMIFIAPFLQLLATVFKDIWCRVERELIQVNKLGGRIF